MSEASHGNLKNFTDVKEDLARLTDALGTTGTTTVFGSHQDSFVATTRTSNGAKAIVIEPSPSLVADLIERRTAQDMFYKSLLSAMKEIIDRKQLSSEILSKIKEIVLEIEDMERDSDSFEEYSHQPPWNEPLTPFTIAISQCIAKLNIRNNLEAKIENALKDKECVDGLEHILGFAKTINIRPHETIMDAHLRIKKASKILQSAGLPGNSPPAYFGLMEEDDGTPTLLTERVALRMLYAHIAYRFARKPGMTELQRMIKAADVAKRLPEVTAENIKVLHDFCEKNGLYSRGGNDEKKSHGKGTESKGKGEGKGNWGSYGSREIFNRGNGGNPQHIGDSAVGATAVTANLEDSRAFKASYNNLATTMMLADRDKTIDSATKALEHAADVLNKSCHGKMFQKTKGILELNPSGRWHAKKFPYDFPRPDARAGLQLLMDVMNMFNGDNKAVEWLKEVPGLEELKERVMKSPTRINTMKRYANPKPKRTGQGAAGGVENHMKDRAADSEFGAGN